MMKPFFDMVKSFEKRRVYRRTNSSREFSFSFVKYMSTLQIFVFNKYNCVAVRLRDECFTVDSYILVDNGTFMSPHSNLLESSLQISGSAVGMLQMRLDTYWIACGNRTQCTFCVYLCFRISKNLNLYAV